MTDEMICRSKFRGDSRDDNVTRRYQGKISQREETVDRSSSVLEEGRSAIASLNSFKKEDLQINSSLMQPSDNTVSWRSDPTSSFSDWTLEVVGIEKGAKKSYTLYHTHSNVIAWGPRRGGFFVHLFQERMNQKPPSKKSRIQVLPSEAALFPLMLDFMYCESSLPLSSGRACTLYAMADKFVVPLLQKAIQNFVEKSLTLTELIEFIQHAQDQQFYKKEIERLVLCATSKLCAYLVKYPSEARLVQPPLLLNTLKKRAGFVKKLKGEDPRTFSGRWEAERSRMLSLVVAECCKAAKPAEDLSYFQFYQFLSHLPTVDSQAALTLLQVDRKLQLSTTKDKHPATYDRQKIMTSFEEKCVAALLEQWRSSMVGRNEKENEKLVESLQDLSPRVLAKLLVRISAKYEHELLMSEDYAITGRQHEILSRRPSKLSSRKTTASPKHKMDSRGDSNKSGAAE